MRRIRESTALTLGRQPMCLEEIAPVRMPYETARLVKIESRTFEIQGWREMGRYDPGESYDSWEG
jgi:hypothetical protein